MRSKILFMSAGLVMVLLVSMLTTYAEVSHDPAAPIPILSDQSLDFTLVGSHGGAFAYYSVQYPGDGRVITIELDMAPGDPVVCLGAGFNLYGPNGYFMGPGHKSLVKTDRKVLQWSNHNPALWLIQVYNYLDGMPVNFHLQVTGLPNPEPTPTHEPVMLALEARTFSIASASLLGNSAGNFHYYEFEAPLSGTEVTLHLYYTPDNYLVSQGFGLNVYGPDGVHYAQGGHDVKFTCPVPGTYLVQVYNYIHSINITYVLTRD